MWEQHLNHLRQIATHRHERLGREPHGYVLWSICELDMYACLLGRGSCEFFQTALQLEMIPSLEHQIPTSCSQSEPYSAGEARIMPTLLHLNQGVLIHTAKVAQVAQRCRAEAAARQAPASPGTYARWQASVSQVQNELLTFWNRSWPEMLGPEAPQAGYGLPSRARYVFEHVSIRSSNSDPRDISTDIRPRLSFSTKPPSSTPAPACFQANTSFPQPTNPTSTPTRNAAVSLFSL